jgi:hypothetical protein
MTQQKEDFIFACENALHYCGGKTSPAVAQCSLRFKLSLSPGQKA